MPQTPTSLAVPPLVPSAHSETGKKSDFRPLSFPQRATLTTALAEDGVLEDVGFDPKKLAPVTPRSTEKSLHRLVANKSGADLHEAIRTGEFTIEDLNRPMFEGKFYPLHLARTPDMAVALIQLGANPNQKNKDRQTALERAQYFLEIGKGSAELVEALKNPVERSESPKSDMPSPLPMGGAGGKIEVPHPRARRPHIEAKESLLDNLLRKQSPEALQASVDGKSIRMDQINALMRDGKWYPIHLVKSAEMLAKLLALGADINQKASAEAWEQTPVQRHLKEPNLLRILLEAGANPNIPDSKGRTPLMRSLEKDLSESVALLRAHGAREAE